MMHVMNNPGTQSVTSLPASYVYMETKWVLLETGRRATGATPGKRVRDHQNQGSLHR